MLLHREALTQRSIYTEELLHREAFTHTSFHTQPAFRQKAFTQQAFTQRSPYTEKHLHGEAFTHSKLLHTEGFTHSQLLHGDAFSQRRITLRSFYAQQAFKLRKSADKSLSRPWCSHTNTIYDVELQKIIILRTQPRRQAALTKPLQRDLRKHAKTIENWVAKHKRTTRSSVRNCSSKTHFVRDSPQKLKVEDMKTKLSRETFLKKWKWKIWKRRFRARLSSKVKVEDMKTKVSCETSLKKWKL